MSVNPNRATGMVPGCNMGGNLPTLAALPNMGGGTTTLPIDAKRKREDTLESTYNNLRLDIAKTDFISSLTASNAALHVSTVQHVKALQGEIAATDEVLKVSNDLVDAIVASVTRKLSELDTNPNPKQTRPAINFIRSMLTLMKEQNGINFQKFDATFVTTTESKLAEVIMDAYIKQRQKHIAPQDHWESAKTITTSIKTLTTRLNLAGDANNAHVLLQNAGKLRESDPPLTSIDKDTASITQSIASLESVLERNTVVRQQIITYVLEESIQNHFPQITAKVVNDYINMVNNWGPSATGAIDVDTGKVLAWLETLKVFVDYKTVLEHIETKPNPIITLEWAEVLLGYTKTMDLKRVGSVPLWLASTNDTKTVLSQIESLVAQLKTERDVVLVAEAEAEAEKAAATKAAKEAKAEKAAATKAAKEAKAEKANSTRLPVQYNSGDEDAIVVSPDHSEWVFTSLFPRIQTESKGSINGYINSKVISAMVTLAKEFAGKGIDIWDAAVDLTKLLEVGDKVLLKEWLREGWFRFGTDSTATQFTIRGALIKWATGVDTSIFKHYKAEHERLIENYTAAAATLTAVVLSDSKTTAAFAKDDKAAEKFTTARSNLPRNYIHPPDDASLVLKAKEIQEATAARSAKTPETEATLLPVQFKSGDADAGKVGPGEVGWVFKDLFPRKETESRITNTYTPVQVIKQMKKLATGVPPLANHFSSAPTASPVWSERRPELFYSLVWGPWRVTQNPCT